MWIVIFIVLFMLLLSYQVEEFNNYKKSKVDGRVFYENCNEICNDNKFCFKFENKKKNYDYCVKCKEKGMCYKKLETNEGICEPCVEGEKYISDCNNTYYDACPSPNDIYNFSGGKPYFVLIPDNNIYNPYNTKCKSCEF